MGQYAGWFQDREGRPYRLREAEERDAAALVSIIAQVGAEEVHIANEGSAYTVEQQAHILRARDRSVQFIAVAEVEGAIVGTLEMVRGTFRKNAHTATFGMALLPSARGRGLGAGLLGLAHRWARDQGIVKVYLSVFSTNGSAIRLYEKMGYRVEGSRPDHYRIGGQPVDEVLMAYYLTEQ